MKNIVLILAALGIFGLLAVEGETFATTLIIKGASFTMMLPAIINEKRTKPQED